MSYADQAFAMGIAIGFVIGWVLGRSHGYGRGHDDGWQLAKRLDETRNARGK